MITELCQELGLDMPKTDRTKSFLLAINPQLAVTIRECPPGFALQSIAAPCPNKKKEDLFIYLMRANFLGQGTGGARIGLDADEKLLTLSYGFPYEMNYQGFKESIEDFVNYVVYWREEVAKFEQEIRES